GSIWDKRIRKQKLTLNSIQPKTVGSSRAGSGTRDSTTCPADPSVSTCLARYRLACTVPLSSAVLYLQTCDWQNKRLRRRLRTPRPKTTSAAAPCWFTRENSTP